MQAGLERAQEVLAFLRNPRGSCYYEYHIGYLRELSIELQSIGTSEEELQALRIKGCKALARRHFRDLKAGYQPKIFAELLHAELKNCNLAPMDIGTTRAKIAELERKFFPIHTFYERP